MKYYKSTLVCCLFIILSSTATKAQFTYTNHIVTVRSDDPSKSVLLSNSFSDRIGDISPIIGAASWMENGQLYQSRSLLEFNYNFLPREVINDPTLVISAELILYPIELATSGDDAGKQGKFFVRRVLECWEDSTTVWVNQPPADSSKHVAEILNKKQKNKPIKIDVTRIVWDMLRFGNKGFMLCNENLSEQSTTFSQWFASPKYDNEKMRPLLVVNFRTWEALSLEQADNGSTNMRSRPGNSNQQQNIPVIVPVKN